MTVDELKIMKDNECILFVRGIYPFFCDKFVIEKHPNYKRLEDSDPDNAYLIKDIETVKFNDSSEQENDDLHSEPVEDSGEADKSPSEDVPKKEDEIEQSVTIEDIIGNQVHTAVQPREFPKAPKSGSVPANLDGSDMVVTTEPLLKPPFTEVSEESYLDDLDTL